MLNTFLWVVSDVKRLHVFEMHSFFLLRIEQTISCIVGTKVETCVFERDLQFEQQTNKKQQIWWGSIKCS